MRLFSPYAGKNSSASQPDTMLETIYLHMQFRKTRFLNCTGYAGKNLKRKDSGHRA